MNSLYTRCSCSSASSGRSAKCGLVSTTGGAPRANQQLGGACLERVDDRSRADGGSGADLVLEPLDIDHGVAGWRAVVDRHVCHLAELAAARVARHRRVGMRHRRDGDDRQPRALACSAISITSPLIPVLEKADHAVVRAEFVVGQDRFGVLSPAVPGRTTAAARRRRQRWCRKSAPAQPSGKSRDMSRCAGTSPRPTCGCARRPSRRRARHRRSVLAQICAAALILSPCVFATFCTISPAIAKYRSEAGKDAGWDAGWDSGRFNGHEFLLLSFSVGLRLSASFCITDCITEQNGHCNARSARIHRTRSTHAPIAQPASPGTAAGNPLPVGRIHGRRTGPAS